MKFFKKYEEYMQVQPRRDKLPRVGFKKLKRILKKCRQDVSRVQSGGVDGNNDEVLLDHHIDASQSSCSDSSCPVCDGTFFPSLMKEMSEVVGFFNENAQRLLEQHLASGFRKCFIWLMEKLSGNHVALIQEGKDLVNYALINAIAMRKILKKYDKIHYSKQGQVFKTQAHSMNIEILQSPWLSELIAFHINSRTVKPDSSKAPALFEGCSLVYKDAKPSLSCELFDSVKVEIDLTCSICLDTVFDPVSLTCGHIFCYMCACKTASVTIVDGLKASHPKKKCPLCREEGVFKGAVHMEELNILLSQSCPEYWKERIQIERMERVKQAKEHWESQCQAFMGM